MNKKGFSEGFYPEDIIAILISGITIFIQIYLYSIGVLTDPFMFITPIVSILVLIFFIVYQSRSSLKTFKFLRSYLHIPFYGIIFSAFQSFVHKLNPVDYDGLLLDADLAVFGFDITRWLEVVTSPWLTEVLTLSYFSYYLLPTLTFILLYFNRGSEAFARSRDYLLSIVIGWYGAFVFYILLPAAGPDIAFPEHYTIPLIGLTPLTSTYLQNLGEYLRESFVRNTFPSMHFAIILITNFFAFRFKSKYFWFCTLPLGTLLGIATVYLRQHYLIDLVGSIPMAALSIYAALKLNQRSARKSAPVSESQT